MHKPNVIVQEQMSSRAGPLASRGTPLEVIRLRDEIATKFVLMHKAELQ